jgi:hypothetical protein
MAPGAAVSGGAAIVAANAGMVFAIIAAVAAAIGALGRAIKEDRGSVVGGGSFLAFEVLLHEAIRASVGTRKGVGIRKGVSDIKILFNYLEIHAAQI